ncbi:DNA-binding pseudobarrel domain containing protein [Trema orientale]|uniref:DNA-binding pseudobarrel domain containing protein n=1 Tax=Trema orientale TaxID=63057 RepID=A0A2P5DUY1_TREOI|nr:DNA-binding pseudobarrel domain containing protein [Trema orientale]
MSKRTRNDSNEQSNNAPMKEIRPRNDPSQWKIRKVLGEPDVALDRMFKFTRPEAEHVLCSIGNERVAKAKEGGDVRVKMVDLDTGTQHELSFRKVRCGNVFGFKLGWLTHFVVRRRLKVGDEIGMYVDPNSSVFYFSVLSSASVDK